MSKHTPGPWEADIHAGPDGYEIADMIEPSICEMSSSHSPEETKANARLIAAAPALLEACKAALQNHEADLSAMNLPRLDKAELDRLVGLTNQLEAAIALAEGKEPT